MMDHFIATPTQLALILKNYRKSLGLTQIELAEKTGLLPKTISLMENSPEKSRIDNLFRLISVLNLELHLNSRDSEPHQSSDVEW